LEAAAVRGRASLSSRRERLRARAWPIAQTALAAGLSWFLATHLFGHHSPAFASIAAVVCIGDTLSHRRRRAIELLVGVSVGIGVGDLLANAIGTGPLQLAAVVALAMLAATLLGAGALIVSEAAVSAVLVVLVVRSNPGISPTRWLDALVGCGVAYVVALVFPRNVARAVTGAADPVFAALAQLLDQVSIALHNGDEALAAEALRGVEDVEYRSAELGATVAEAQAEVRYTPVPRTKRRVAAYAGAAPQTVRMVRNVHALSRASMRLLRHQQPGPPALADAVSDLAWSVRLLSGALVDDELRDETVRLALRASDEAAAAGAQDEGDVGVGIVVDIIRAAAFDVVRAAGIDDPDAEALLGEHAGRP
jgi:uncharacterized membrane protein YccC